MMEYEVFKQVVEERIGEFLPPIFGACKVSVSTVRKVNQEKDALQVIPEHSEQITAIPNIYLDEMYETFKECQDLSEVMRMIAAMVIHYTGSFRPDKADLDFCSKKDSIVMNLINTARNRELLEAVPHKDVMDLSVIYRIIMEKQGDGLATVLLNHELMKEMDISNEELERLAYENTARMFPVEIMKLAETLYVMTNRSKLHGATTMLYKDAVRQLADAVGSSFFLIPSSIHEVMAVPEQKADLKKLVRMLEEGNRTCGPESEILSNTIYHYDRESNTMTMAASYFSEEELAEADQLFSGEQ